MICINPIVFYHFSQLAQELSSPPDQPFKLKTAKPLFLSRSQTIGTGQQGMIKEIDKMRNVKM